MNLSDYLNSYTSDTLRDLGRDLLEMPSKITRKGMRIAYIKSILLNSAELRSLWNKLDPIAQKAVTAAVHNDGEFDSTAFVAQFGQLPPRPKGRNYYSRTAILFDLFVYQGRIPDDMLPLLAAIVPEPERFQLEGLTETPQTQIIKYLDWNGEVTSEEEVGLISAETERIGWTDLLSYLRLLERGDIKRTTTGLLTAKSLSQLFNLLVEGEYFPISGKLSFKETQRIFGLVQFVDQCGFGWRNGISKKGREFLQTRDPELLLEAFEKWAEEGSFDELTRIAAGKKLKSKNTRLTKPFDRRSKIIEALSWCPTDVWINIDNFYRAVMIWQFDFDVEDPRYYRNLTFGYSSSYFEWESSLDYWRALKGLSINAVIWEYLATIGAVDIAYARAGDAIFALAGDYNDGESYSDYDGLCFFRINPLGAYLLGQADEYIPSEPEVAGVFEISADKQITVIHPDAMTPDRQMMLEVLAEPVAENQYRLTSAKLLDAVSQGYEFAVILDFLTDNHNGALPGDISQWLAQLEHNRKAFKVSGQAVFITISNKANMQLVKTDPTLSKFCTPINNKTVVVVHGHLTAVRNRLKTLEFLLAE